MVAKTQKPLTDLSTWKETDKAYLAAFLDTDGHLSVTVDGKRGVKSPFICFTNSHKETIDFAAFLTHHPVYTRLSVAGIKIFTVRVNRTADVKSILSALLPYIKGKRAQAMTIIELCQKRIEGLKITPDEVRSLRDLNAVHNSNVNRQRKYY